MISIKGLNKFFNKGRSNELHVINNMDLQLPEKGMVAIFGKSGCGKTTLLNVIGGLDGYQSGNVAINGENIREATDKLRNRYIGYVFQNYYLNNSISCYDNVADALRLCGVRDKKEIDARVNAALANVDMLNYKNRTPDTLSGGQQQRIAIARAIVKSPRIILADEPTGNLDETNTVMVMDMLKRLSKDHLVLLVTHEAELVDYYCDITVELRDGCIIDIRNNNSANGFSTRDKNHIYLGELERKELCDDGTQVEFYGDTPTEPVKLKIVNYNGKLYVHVDTADVQILDSYSEIKLKEGVYSQKEQKNRSENTAKDMAELPRIEGKRFGKLFNLWASVKSGYLSNFSTKKRGKDALCGCLVLFAAVWVIMCATFGTAISNLLDARSSYNHNVFYIYTPDADTSDLLIQGMNSGDSGIDYMVIHSGGNRLKDRQISFRTGAFETFSSFLDSEGFSANAVYMSRSLADGKELLAGSNTDLKENEIIISSKVADMLLETSTLGYIKDYGDLIGLISTDRGTNGNALRISAVVASDESAIYTSDIELARQALSLSSLSVAVDKDLSYSVEKGKVIYYHESLDGRGDDGEGDIPNVGDKIKIHGVELEISTVLRLYTTYDEWLVGNNINKLGYDTFVTEKHPDEALDEIGGKYIMEWFDYKYSELDRFIEDYYKLRPYDIQLWLAVEKNIDCIKYLYASPLYWAGIKYEELYGKLPTENEINESMDTLPDIVTECKKYAEKYESEFYDYNSPRYLEQSIYILDESDYIAISKQKGETHRSAISNEYGYKDSVSYDDYKYYGDLGYNGSYMLLHSSDPKKTNKWIDNNIDRFVAPEDDEQPMIVTPDDIFNGITEESKGIMVSELITMVIVLALLSVCMFFIMRSSIFARVKEIGIYRAIGVSKGNLVFRSVVEVSVLSLFTVFVGYIFSSIFIWACMGISPLISQLMYYPAWYATAVFIILAGISIICGILPTVFLLRRTPSQILSKYDI